MNDILPNDDPEYCHVCGQSLDVCPCPECSMCGACGDPACYHPNGHGLVMTHQQRRLRIEALDYLMKEAGNENPSFQAICHADKHRTKLWGTISKLDQDVL